MIGLLEVVVANAAIALPLAAVAWWLGRVCPRRPALVHAAWLLVLLKLVTPPLVEIPVLSASTDWTLAAKPLDEKVESSVLTFGETEPVSPRVLEPEFEFTDPEDDLFLDPDAEESLDEIRPISETGFDEPTQASDWVVVPASRSTSPQTTMTPRFAWRVIPWSLALWGLVSLLLAGVALRRIWRFSRALRDAAPAPRALRRRAQFLGARLGLKASKLPEILIVEARVSPMLFGLGSSTRLLLPGGLIRNVDGERLDMLLLHELAHFQRRDHWVRVLELVVATVYWWHPAVWLARRELRRVEEEACDARVMETSPDARRVYARALVDCVDFVATSPSPLPPVASAMGDSGFLKRRVSMIMSRNASARLSGAARFGVVAVALLALPLVPGKAQNVSANEAAGSNLSGQDAVSLTADNISLNTQQGSASTLEAGSNVRLNVQGTDDGVYRNRGRRNSRSQLSMDNDGLPSSRLEFEIRIEAEVKLRLERVMRRAPSGALKEEIDASRARLKELKSQRLSKASRMNRSRNRDRARELQARELHNLESELARREAALNALSQQREIEMQRALDLARRDVELQTRKDDLRRHSIEMERRLVDLETMKSRLADETEALKRKLDKSAGKKGDRRKLTERLQSLRAQQDELSSAKRSLDRERLQIKEMELELDPASRETKELRAKMRALQAELEALNAERRALDNQQRRLAPGGKSRTGTRHRLPSRGKSRAGSRAGSRSRLPGSGQGRRGSSSLRVIEVDPESEEIMEVEEIDEAEPEEEIVEDPIVEEVEAAPRAVKIPSSPGARPAPAAAPAIKKASKKGAKAPKPAKKRAKKVNVDPSIVPLGC